MSVKYIGLSLAWECFHVREKPSPQARNSFKYAWTPVFKELRELQGRVSDPNRWLSTVQLEVKDIRTQRTVGQTKATGGRFGFASIPEGEYVLVISAKETSGLELVRVNSAASRLALDLTVIDSTCGLMIGPAR